MSSFYIYGCDVLGDEPKKGFDPTMLVNLAAEAANRGIDYAEQKKAGEQAAADKAKAEGADREKLERAKVADQALASALTTLDLSKQSKDEQKIVAAQAVADVAASAAASAGAGLSYDALAKRTDAVTAAMKKAADESLSSPKDVRKAARLRAWQQVAQRVAAAAPAAQPMGAPSGGFGEWLTRRHAGVPTWGWGLGGLTLSGLATAIVVKLARRRRRP